MREGCISLIQFVIRFWQRAGVSDKITTMIAPAADSLRKLKADGHPQFDCVFIDADKPCECSVSDVPCDVLGLTVILASVRPIR